MYLVEFWSKGNITIFVLIFTNQWKLCSLSKLSKKIQTNINKLTDNNIRAYIETQPQERWSAGVLPPKLAPIGTRHIGCRP